ncbi:unnamed protein product [Rotaria sp. Silwood1]|nr:unnamed protein product [Rotaria sp. Silwood1]CAF0903932.1 unnamed protein product [Rotaria sp. Silwood1]CAF3373752.1 unnamed protein product [Rotaria sp. Silwood1]CAF3389485.1 unnamed protein product [Rotaria sp. Silwood1]CAF4600013.1 unnamed protein product [Rotaria sp. Silwood1]
MNAMNVKTKMYRIPLSLYWEKYWHPWPIGILATFQLIMAFTTISMEIGNAVVDLFRANVYSGFWSFPFMISATIATYACVCATKTQTKAIVALILQIISMLVMLVVIGFLITFIATNFTLCLGFQCFQTSSSSHSSSTYTTIKQVFIVCELVFSIIYTILSIIYIILFIKCYNKISRIHPIVHSLPVSSGISNKTLTNFSRSRQSGSVSTISNNRSNINEQVRLVSSTYAYNGAQKVCPNCKHVSSYMPQENIIECPKCGYQSNLVEHAQQY